MIELNAEKHSTSKTDSLVFARKTANNEVISIEECKGYFGNSQISDKAIKTLRNNLVGVVDSVINTYLDDFR